MPISTDKNASAAIKQTRRIYSFRAMVCAIALACVTLVHADATKQAKPLTMSDVLAASKASDWRALDADNTLYLELAGGRVVIELSAAYAPKHAENIKALVREKYFDGLAILRVQDNYVVQWGDPESDDKTKQRVIKNAQRTLAPEFTRKISADLPFTRLPDVDGYAPQVGFSNGFPVGRDPKTGDTWLAHCYGMVGVGRDNAVDSGSGAELYVVIGNAPRHLDRNIAVVGRVVQGIELLSSLPRGTGALGFYEKPEQRIAIKSVRLAADVPAAERSQLEVIRTDTPTFAALVESRRNRHDEWYKVPAGNVELCNVPIVVRPIAASAK
ncbi:peptidylprolyl isomerase [Pseudolysobacter antarcticus]|nr:peptidylprolyl isomerase [Pseudolysobacter antarcticus]